MAKKKLKAAILGFGGMGHVHAAQYSTQKDVELVAVCDIDPTKFEQKNAELNFGSSGSSDSSVLRKYLSYDEMAAAEKGVVDYIDIALPSDLHCEYSIRAMQDGFHVLCEKPMALNSADAQKMIRVSNETGKFLMIAQCLRFNGRFQLIKDAYEKGTYGKLLRLSSYRCGSFPGGWFREVERSGGALMDLHLHDIDFVLSVLGMPDELSTYGVVVKSGGIDDSVTNYTYKDGPIVTCEGSWARKGFSCAMFAVFEEGTIEISDNAWLYQMDKKVKKLRPGSKQNHYFNEIAYFASCVKKGKRPEIASMESTAETIQIIELEQKSAFAGGKRIKVR